MNNSWIREDSTQTILQSRSGVKDSCGSPMRPELRAEGRVSRNSGANTASRASGASAAGYFEGLRNNVAPLRERLLRHPVYSEVNSLDRLQEFMRIHVFAVWDFMSLIKRLQRDVTALHLPWTPPASAEIARFTNEVVLGEESDLGPSGKPESHFELYLRAMEEVGAQTADIRAFITRVEHGENWETTLKELNVPAVISDFVSGTLHCAIYGSVVEVASYFFFGREDVIPDMFRKLLVLWKAGAVEVPHFAFYLERHIELDGDSHGPWARRMLIALAGEDEDKWLEAHLAARRALESRFKLWDGVVAHVKKAP